MKSFNQLFILLLLNIVSTTCFSQSITISGYIQDIETKEQLIGCNIIDSLSQKGTVTNNFGFFSYSLKKGTTLCFSYIGYQAQCQHFNLPKDTSIIIQLVPLIVLNGVEVFAQKDAPQQEEMSIHYLQIKTIKLLPTAVGEIDVMKSMQLLPGVQSGSEGQTGLYVRGGSPDQNLILIDDVPIYYASHALGFLSVFNADAIKNVSLTKGAFPARFGGRLSSVVEIRMKEGNLKERHGEVSIGLLSSKFTLEGPIKKEKTSFIISARRTYLDVLAKPIIKKLANPLSNISVKPSIYFYDLNGKVHHIINKKNKLYLNTYFGADVLGFQYRNGDDEYGSHVNWKNAITSLRWSTEWTNKLFSNTTFYYSKYNININSQYKYNRDLEDRLFSSKYQSGIRDFGIKVDFDFIPKQNHYIKFGSAIVAHQYNPGAVSIQSNIIDISIDTLLGSAKINNIESDFYVEDEITIGHLKANIGLHSSLLQTIINKQHFSIQPRFSMSYKLKKGVFIKGAYSFMNQNINLLSSDILNLPSDIWIPSTDKIIPQTAHQFVLGITTPVGKQFNLSIETYYKQFKNVVAYKEGSNFITGIGKDWENNITQGKGTTYGAEFFLQKTKGKTTGWVGYTLAWNWRKFKDLNQGKRFPYRYDRRHDISIVVSHQFNEKIKASAVWIYSTGNAISLPTYRYATSYFSDFDIFENRLYEYFDDILKVTNKNTFRLSSYHRLDLSVEFLKKKKKYERIWKISTYNTYFHSNPYIILPDYEENKITLKEISLLPFLIPSFIWQIKF